MPGKKERAKLAELLNGDLLSFGHCFEGKLLCPTCMEELHIDRDSQNYTIGHIVPQAVGGKDWTILCKRCNSVFGSKQDKWFGEYLDILENPEGTLIHAKTKSRYININSVNVSGSINVSKEDGAVDVFIPLDLNKPGIVESIEVGADVEIGFAPVLMKHVNEIQVGYITAAYLKWFEMMGYSWVLQSSLNMVRKQIMDCDYSLDGAKVVELKAEDIHQPSIGVIEESGYVYPCCLVFDRAVIFPAPFPTNAPSPKSVSFDSSYQLTFLEMAIMDAPYSLSYEGRLAVLPDMLRQDPPIPEYMLNIPQSLDEAPHWLRLKR